MRKTLVCLFVGLALFLGGTTSAIAKPKKEATAEASDEAKAADKKDKGESKKEDKKEETPFEDLVEDFEKVEGLFTFYHDDEAGKVFMEIRPEQFDTTYLCSLTRSAGDGYFFDSGAMIGGFPFQLKRVGKRVQFIHENVYFRADKTAAIHRALRRGLSDSIIGATKIEGAAHPDTGSVLVDPSGFFVQDIQMVGYIFKEFIKDHSYSFDKDNSYFGAIRAFPHNSEIDVHIHFKSSSPKSVPTLGDPRSFMHVYHYSLSSIPETEYQARLGDDRVGHFLTMHQDFTSPLRDTPYVRYVNRWHLEKAEPKFEQSKPRKPIVFWLENTVPVEYRDAVTRGILLWNDAFERIGFKDAIVVKQQPDDADWDPADVRYNTVRWIVRPGGGYAVGPSRTDPFTGQIYDADIRVSADMLRSVYLTYDGLAEPVANGDAIAASLGLLAGPQQGLCDYQDGIAEQAAFGHALISVRSAASSPDGAGLEDFLNGFLVQVMAHEVGHTLGLRHNFKASTIHENGALQGDEAARVGLTGSVTCGNQPRRIVPGRRGF